MRVSIFCTTFVWNVSHSNKNWARYGKDKYWSTCKVTYSCQILMKLEFFDRFSKNTRISDFMKIRPVGAELFLRADVTKVAVASRNFANAPKKWEPSSG